MKKILTILRLISITSVLTVISSLNLLSQPVSGTADSIKASGWVIIADQNTARLTISHDSLGILISDVTLNSISGNMLRQIRNWVTIKKEADKLSVFTDNPATRWIFEAKKDRILITATVSGLCITAKAQAGPDRIVAHLLDPEGFPVDWCGTTEIADSWHGKDTHNPSFLPSQNPEVMTFALGQVSSSNIHSLFDRKRDIAIDFPLQTVMKRNSGDQNILNITIPVPGSSQIILVQEYFTKTLGLPFYSRFDDTIFPTAPQIWGSWTAYYQEVKESDITFNADWIAENLKQFGIKYVQLDDGYDRAKEEGHNWIENWNKNTFPHGPEWLAGYIKSKGLKPGLWLVPNSYLGAFQQHPDWYLYNKSGEVITDYLTPALDQTNPAVQDWLKKLLSTLRGWGFEYLKFDGEFSLPKYVPDIDTSRIYNKKTDQLYAYRERLKLIRSIIGPETFVEGCNSGTPLNGIGYFNSCFNGNDMYNSWKGSYAVFSSISANAFMNHLVSYVMPGEGIDVSPLMSPEEAHQKMVHESVRVALTRENPFTGFGTTMAEARTLVSIVSLTGVSYPITSILPRLPEERVSLLKMTMPTLPVMPVDLYSRGSDMTWDKFKFTTTDTYIHNYPEIIDLKVNAVNEAFDVAAVTNWRGETISRIISMKDKLGTDQPSGYIVFDFWNRKLLGKFSDQIEVTVEPHDTRVLFVHPDLGHPQLVGISRHISCSYSLSSVDWDKDSLSLKGNSETLKREPYSLFIYVPDGVNVVRIKAATGDNTIVETASQLSDNLLKVDLQSNGGNVKWLIQFAEDSR